jgi:hypothetical protein
MPCARLPSSSNAGRPPDGSPTWRPWRLAPECASSLLAPTPTEAGSDTVQRPTQRGSWRRKSTTQSCGASRESRRLQPGACGRLLYRVAGALYALTRQPAHDDGAGAERAAPAGRWPGGSTTAMLRRCRVPPTSFDTDAVRLRVVRGSSGRGAGRGEHARRGPQPSRTAPTARQTNPAPVGVAAGLRAAARRRPESAVDYPHGLA